MISSLVPTLFVWVWTNPFLNGGAPSQNLPMVALPKYDSAGRGIVLEAIDREHGMDSPGAERSVLTEDRAPPSLLFGFWNIPNQRQDS